ncbi:putative receptor expression-enhancing protein 2 isoform X2, partial [Apostichopus japonicus]
VKWMMYWIVFALFSCFETFADIFASILPLYYEIKIVFILWLISPWTKGSTYLYRKFVHPTLSKRETEIDEYLNHASTKGYEVLKKVGTDGLTIAANVMVNSAMKGQTTLLDHLKNYSAIQKSGAPALTEPREEEETDAGENVQFRDAYQRLDSQYSDAYQQLDNQDIIHSSEGECPHLLFSNIYGVFKCQNLP